MAGANCFWALLRHDGSGTLESAASKAASTPAALAREASLSLSSDEDDASSSASRTSPPPSPSQQLQLFHLFDAALRGFLASARCLTRDSERYSVEARSLASSGSLDAAFNFLGRALEVCGLFFLSPSLSSSRPPPLFPPFLSPSSLTTIFPPPFHRIPGRRDLQGDV